jgi:hypothetical protein
MEMVLKIVLGAQSFEPGLHEKTKLTWREKLIDKDFSCFFKKLC